LKSLTHNLFSLGVGLFLLLRTEQPPNVLDVLLVIWLAFATNWVIDSLGHTSRNGLSVRSFRTHSVLLAPIWGITIALVSLFLLDTGIGQKMTTPEVVYFAGLGEALAFSHLLLDALTEGGVFLVRRRIALAHLRNNNIIANGAFLVLGVLLIVGSLV
jgi:hypothetical protein